MTPCLLLLVGCLERVTGEPQPLDPRFTGNAGAPAVDHQPMPPGAPGGPPQGAAQAGDRFGDVDGPRVQVSGAITVAPGSRLVDGAVVDLDLFRPDDSPAGRSLLSKVKVGVGPYAVDVPAGLGPLEVEALVDPDGDGPTPGDLFGRPEPAMVEVGQAPVAGVDIVLRRAEAR